MSESKTPLIDKLVELGGLVAAARKGLFGKIPAHVEICSTAGNIVCSEQHLAALVAEQLATLQQQLAALTEKHAAAESLVFLYRDALADGPENMSDTNPQIDLDALERLADNCRELVLTPAEAHELIRLARSGSGYVEDVPSELSITLEEVRRFCKLYGSAPDHSEQALDMVASELTPEYEAELRGIINPLYMNQRGTESYERRVLLGEIDRLRAMVAASQQALDRVAADGWMPIESAPKDGTPVDLWHRDGFLVTETWWDREDGCWVHCFEDADFTHWMPLPTAPIATIAAEQGEG